MNDQRDIKVPTSFTFFNQMEDPFFLQYLQTYCSAIQKKQKDTYEKAKKTHFFMQDEQYITNPTSNIFSKNLSINSINYFEFNEPIHSIQNFRQDFEIKKEDDLKIQGMNECKIQAQSQDSDNNLVCQEMNKLDIGNKQSFAKKGSQIMIKLRNQQQGRRLNQIIKETNIVKNQLQDLMKYFNQNITQEQ